MHRQSSGSLDSVAQAFRRGGTCTALRGLRVTVMGLGRFGGGVGVVNHLLKEGAQVSISDASAAIDLQQSLQAIDVAALAGLHLGEHRPEHFEDADVIVVNPAVKRSHPLLQRAAALGKALTSEIILYWTHRRGRTVAVTGTVGKSTTAALIQAMLRAGGLPVHLGGNIGGSLLGSLDHIQTDDWVVLELSSFQLWDLGHLCFAPEIAVVTNFFPNHLDWHEHLDDYRRAKQIIWRAQQPDHVRIQNSAVAELASWPGTGRRILFGKHPPDAEPAVHILPEGMRLSGPSTTALLPRHCWCPRLAGDDLDENVAAATAAAVYGCGVDVQACAEALRSFQPLPHRRHVVGEWAGRTFINDSKATTPEAAIAALNALAGQSGRILLIAGGADKGSDLSRLACAIAERKCVSALVGQTAAQLEKLIRACPGGDVLEIRQCPSLQEAFGWLTECSCAGDTILLSPGCASFGEFLNYQQRGESFERLVHNWSTRHSTPPASL